LENGGAIHQGYECNGANFWNCSALDSVVYYASMPHFFQRFSQDCRCRMRGTYMLSGGSRLGT